MSESVGVSMVEDGRLSFLQEGTRPEAFRFPGIAWAEGQFNFDFNFDFNFNFECECVA